MNVIPSTTVRMLATALSLILVSLAGCMEDFDLYSGDKMNCSAEQVIGDTVLMNCEGEEQLWKDPKLADTFSDLSRSTAITCKVGKSAISCDPSDGMVQVDLPPAKEVVPCIPIVFDWNRVGCHNAISPDKLPSAEELAEKVSDVVNRIAEEVDEPNEVIDVVDKITNGETPTCLLEDLLCESEPVPLGLG